MLEQIKYINHLNEVINFGKDGILVNKNDLRDFEWTYNKQYSVITSFSRQAKAKKLPFLIYGNKSIANKMFEVFEKDVLAEKAGKLYIGDYYLQGYFYKSVKSDYNRSDIVKGELGFIPASNMWIKAVNYVYRLRNMEMQGGKGYEYDYPYDYISSISMQSLNNTSFVPCNFIMTLYGAVPVPELIINGHSYHVDTEINNNEYLTINSFDKTIIKTTATGEKVNLFSKRDLDSYIFEKIPTGNNKVLAVGDINYDITLLMERSEPEWT